MLKCSKVLVVIFFHFAFNTVILKVIFQKKTLNFTMMKILLPTPKTDEVSSVSIALDTSSQPQ